MKKRLFAVILAAAMALCSFPATASAAGESGIQLGTGGLKVNDWVYFGAYTDTGTTYDVPWIMLNTNGLLLSKYLFGDSQFRTESSGYYKDGALNSRMNDLYNGTNTLFTPLEQGAIAAKTNLDCADGGIASPSVDQAYLYPMSLYEMRAFPPYSVTLRAPYITNPSGSNAWWWMRSNITETQAYLVAGDGGDGFHPVTYLHGVRPMCNLNLTSVLFTSPSVGGKASGPEGANALNPNLSSSGTTSWKLTLDDSANRGSFAVSTTAISKTTLGGNAEIAYSGAKVGTLDAPEYLSAMIVDSSNTVLYYGRLKSIAGSADASGTQTIAIPALAEGSYTLKIFNEQYNGDMKTDYSSAFEDVMLIVRDGIELRINDTHIQWRDMRATTWNDLIALSALKGADGATGATGAAGQDGANGADGANGTDGANGRDIELQTTATHIQWRYVGDTTWTDLVMLSMLKGADGADGVNGADGKDGANGVNGADGRDGVNGADGRNGVNGKDGQDSIGIRSIKKTGSEGGLETYTIYLTDGASFAFTVANGKSGNGIVSVKIDQAGDLIVTLSDGSEINAGSVRETALSDNENRSGDADWLARGFALLALAGNAGWIVPLLKKRKARI